jgi:arylsulfatase A-like enzyme
MSNQPNLIFLMPDQLRPDFLGCYGADFVHTPNIDALAAAGTRYTRAYSTSPVCVPARASLLTGMGSLRTGVLDNGLWLRPDYGACGIRTWPEALGAAGYYTASVGKMHFYPWDLRHGLHYRVVAEDKRWLEIRDDYYQHLREQGERKYHGNEHEGYLDHKGAIINRLPWELSVDHFVGVEACRFLETYGGEEPFALMVGFPGPHCPYDPNEEFLEKVDPAQMPPAIPGDTTPPQLRANNVEGNRRPWNGVDYGTFTDADKQKIRAHYAASVNQIDLEIGRIVETLRAQGLLDNTVIIFASDHGDYLGDHNLIGKGTYYEGSIHVPMIVRMPNGPQAVQDNLVELTDVTATLLALSGAEVPQPLDARPLPGLDLPTTPREILFGFVSGGWMAYDGQWKLCKYGTGEHQLFDLATDPTEQHNRIDDPAAFAELRRLDDALTREVMRATVLAQHPQRVYAVDLAQSKTFGKEGWQRPYPRPFGATFD